MSRHTNPVREWTIFVVGAIIGFLVAFYATGAHAQTITMQGPKPTPEQAAATLANGPGKTNYSYHENPPLPEGVVGEPLYGGEYAFWFAAGRAHRVGAFGSLFTVGAHRPVPWGGHALAVPSVRFQTSRGRGRR